VPRLPKPEDLRARKERHKQRGKAYRVAFVAVAFALIALGLALVPLPGPGWLVVALGVAMLSLEFDRAERLLAAILVRLDKIGEQASEAGPLVKGLAIALTVLGLVGSIAVVVLFDLPYFPG
jgi:uncharacterized protein (TIGR02611 family)